MMPLLNTWLDNNRRALSGKIVRGELEYIQGWRKEKLLQHHIAHI